MRGWSLLLLAALCLVTGHVRGEDVPRVAVVYGQAVDSRIPDRLRAELSALGMDVVPVFFTADEPPPTLDSAARGVGAVAALGMLTATGGIEVWVADRTTGKTVLREFLAGPSRTVDDVVALQAVELLRARLVEVPPAPSQPPAEPGSKPPPTSAPVQHERAATLWLEFGPGISTGPTGTAVHAHGFIGVRWRMARRFGVDVWGRLPLTRSSIDRPTASAEVAPWLFAVNASLWLSPARANWQFVGSAGVAGAHLAISGDAQPPLTAQSDSVTTALPFVRASLARRIGKSLALGVDGIVGVAAPRPSIRFSGSEVAEWGRPLVAGTLYCDVALN